MEKSEKRIRRVKVKKVISSLRLASWIAFLVSSAVIILGGIEEIRNHQDKGLYIVYAGFIGLALSGLLMTIAYSPS